MSNEELTVRRLLALVRAAEEGNKNNKSSSPLIALAIPHPEWGWPSPTDQDPPALLRKTDR